MRTFPEWLFGYKARYKKKQIRRMNSAGYPMIHCPEHPRAWKDGYVGESIWAWENYHNACLLGWSRVIHKDGNKLNVKKDNLIATRTFYDILRHKHVYV